jgi:hypothetical protein
MKRTGIFLLTVFIGFMTATGVIFAQTTAPTPDSTLAQVTNPTPTEKVTPPPSTPAPTTAPTTTQVTPAPTVLEEKPTSTPHVIQQTQTNKPTPTPTQEPPTPTPKPKPFVLAITKKPPVSPLNGIITAPFDLVMNTLPQNYYSDQGLAPTTTRILLAVSFLCLMSGTVLLAWPSILRTKKRLVTAAFKQRKAIPYLAGRV